MENSLVLKNINRALFSFYYEVILKRFSTSFNWSLLDKRTTMSFFSNTEVDLGNITLLFLTIAPTLTSSGKLESLIDLFTSSDVSKIFASKPYSLALWMKIRSGLFPAAPAR